LLNIDNLKNGHQPRAIYSTGQFEFMSDEPFFDREESPTYGIRADEPGEVCWRLADSGKPFDLHRLIDDFASWYERVADLRGYRLTIDIGSGLPKYIEGNVLMLGFLLWDLASYSQVFLGSKGVRIEVHSEPFSGDWHAITFSLTVPGLGLPMDKEQTLFQAPGSNGKRTGDGHAASNLYYAGMIAGLLGGRLRIRNRIGYGTEYIAEICLQGRPD
jgi:hypothetical protein